MTYYGLPEDLQDLEVTESFYESENDFMETIWSPLSPGNNYSFCDEITRFQQRDVTEWTMQDVIDWLHHFCKEQNLENVNVIGFSGVSGHQLLAMTRADFKCLDSVYGSFLYDQLKSLRHSHSTKSKRHSGKNCPKYDNSYFDMGQSSHVIGAHSSVYEVSSEDYGCNSFGSTSNYQLCGGGICEEESSFNIDDLQSSPMYLSQASGFQSDSTGLCLPSSLTPPESDVFRSDSSNSMTSFELDSRMDDLRIKSPVSGEKKSKRRQRGPKLWEFLLGLLEDPKTNPSLIRWEDHAEGVFRLMQPEHIARKWGQRGGKEGSLSYDYFARALRYHYKSGTLISVPERKLVYKFNQNVL